MIYARNSNSRLDLIAKDSEAENFVETFSSSMSSFPLNIFFCLA